MSEATLLSLIFSVLLSGIALGLIAANLQLWANRRRLVEIARRLADVNEALDARSVLTGEDIDWLRRQERLRRY